MAGIALGVFTFGIDVFGEFAFSDALWAGENMELTWAAAVTILGVGAIVVTNELDGSDYETWEYGLIIGALAIVPVYVLVPQFATWVDTYDYFALLLTVAVSAASIFISYTE